MKVLYINVINMLPLMIVLGSIVRVIPNADIITGFNVIFTKEKKDWLNFVNTVFIVGYIHKKLAIQYPAATPTIPQGNPANIDSIRKGTPISPRFLKISERPIEFNTEPLVLTRD